MRGTDPEAQRLAGEILVLEWKGPVRRTAEEEFRYAELLSRFGDHRESALSYVRARGKRRK